jgi:hypothetical protein
VLSGEVLDCDGALRYVDRSRDCSRYCRGGDNVGASRWQVNGVESIERSQDRAYQTTDAGHGNCHTADSQASAG